MRADEIVTTADGKQHRVIYETGGKLFVKSVGGKKSGPAYKICATKVVKREKR